MIYDLSFYDYLLMVFKISCFSFILYGSAVCRCSKTVKRCV